MDSKPRKLPFLHSMSIFILALITGCALLMILSSIGNERSQCLDIQHWCSAKVRFWVQDIKTNLEKLKGRKIGEKSKTSKNDESWPMRMSANIRRMLSGPGSSPPRCTAKCGRCLPCKPVHVSVPPGTPVSTEYYPEAWRCKCGNKIYMP